MPVVLRVKGYRFWFYEADLDEPPHVHIVRIPAERLDEGAEQTC